MFEYLAYMLIPTLLSLAIIHFAWLAPLSLQKKAISALPFVLVVALAMFFFGEIGTISLRPWYFDCSKTVGVCPFGEPVVEDFLFCFLVVLNVTSATIAFSEIDRRSASTKDFALSFLRPWKLKRKSELLPINWENRGSR